MQNFILLYATIVSVVKLSVIVLRVAAPKKRTRKYKIWDNFDLETSADSF
jgi:hypothetical protein